MSTSRIRVLVIDDDQLFRSLIVSVLRKEFLVSVAATGQEGYSKAREHRPDIAVIDVQMPGWSGIDTLKAFNRDPLLRGVKTIMLTADASKETVLAAVHSGADDYVIKSCFNKNEFIYKIHKQILGPAAAQELSAAQDQSLSFSRTNVPEASTESTSHTATVKPGETHFSSRKDAVSATAVSSTSAVDDSRVQEIVDSWE